MKQKKTSLIIIAIILASAVYPTSIFSVGNTQSSESITKSATFSHNSLNNQQYNNEKIIEKNYEHSNLSEENKNINYSSNNFGQTIYNYKNNFSPKNEHFLVTQPGSDYYYYEPNHYSISQNSFSNSPIMKIVDDAIEVVIKVSPNFDTNYFEMVLNNVEAEIVNNQTRLNAYVVNVPIRLIDQLQTQLEDSVGFDYLEPHHYRFLLSTPNDPLWDQQWGPQLIGLEDAWEVNTGNRSILVAIVDTGIDYNHEDLVDAYLDIGYDWYNDDEDPFDDHYHGTHCAGTVAAAINNSKGVAGVANVSIFAEKIFGGSGDYAGDINAAAAIDHAAEQGAHVISNSWGGSGYSQLIADAVTNAVDNGSIVVAAAGNDDGGPVSFPANLANVIAVSATDENDELASFSNYGEEIAVAAPGVNIWSTMPGNAYDTLSGTSMATPHVSGLIALIMSEFEEYTPQEVIQLLYLSADDLGPEGFDTHFGHGRINASRAMQGFPEHELFAQLEVNTIIPLNEMQLINATVNNVGVHTETDVEFNLYIDQTVVESVIINSLESKKNFTLTHEWTPTTVGSYNITTYVVPVPGEEYINNNAISKMIKATDLTIIDPIMIESNTDFSSKYNFPGEGTPEDPYMIQGYYVLRTGTARISIQNTNAHFIIKNCQTENTLYGTGIGIHLFSVSNGLITDTIINDNWIGVLLEKSTNNTAVSNSITNSDYGLIIDNNSTANLISENTISNQNVAIGVWTSNDNIFTNNSISDNWRGFNIGDTSTANLISDNTITNHDEDIAIGLWDSSYNIINNNTLSNNLRGVYVSNSDTNVFTANTIEDNSNYGLYIYSGTHNTIYENIFTNNLGTSSQGYDDGTDNLWYNETLKKGNYWSDWTTGNYSIDGSAESQDIYPNVDNEAPVITDINFSPEVPKEDDEIIITASVTDNFFLDLVALNYSGNGEEWLSVPMSHTNEDIYSVTIGPFKAGSTIQFHISANDTANNTAESSIQTFSVLDEEPPQISNIEYDPEVPTKQDEITITTEVTDNVEVEDVKLYYRLDQGEWIEVNMMIEGLTYTAKIGPFEADTTIEFYIYAEDVSGNIQESQIISFSITSDEEPTDTTETTDKTDPTESDDDHTEITSFSSLVLINMAMVTISLIISKYVLNKKKQ